jgi:hypothetical protein
MARSLPARLTASEGRKFGVTVGLAFAALASIAWWREAPAAATVFAVLGGSLLLAGLLIPARLGPVQRGWMRFALLISKVTTPVLMGVIYFVIITPVGLIRRAMGHNSLVRRTGAPELASGGVWVQRPPDKARSDLNRQY